MSATVLKLDKLQDALHRKRGRTGICQNQPARRARPDFESHADRPEAGVDDREPGRFAWSLEAQERMAHWLAQWWPLLVLATVSTWLGWLLLG